MIEETTRVGLRVTKGRELNKVNGSIGVRIELVVILPVIVLLPVPNSDYT